MAKKKNNNKRNLALGIGGLVASGLVIKNGKALSSLARKAYDSTKRLGKKRGKYKTSTDISFDDRPTVNIEVPKKENVTQYINRTKGKPKLTKAERSALTKERQKKLDYTTLSPEKRKQVWDKMKGKERGELFDSLTPEEKLKYYKEHQTHNITKLKELKNPDPTFPYFSKWEYKNRNSWDSKEVKEEVDRLRKLGQYSKQLYLISDFTLYE